MQGWDWPNVSGWKTVAADAVLDEALAALFNEIDLKSDIYNVSIPADRASFRNLSMPFKDPKKIRQTLPFEIETMLPFPIDDLIVDFDIKILLAAQIFSNKININPYFFNIFYWTNK